MTPELNEAGYLHTKVKLADLLERRARTIPRGSQSSSSLEGRSLL